MAWPFKIADQIELTEEQLDQDEQKFQKKLQDDQTQLDDRLDSVQVCKIHYRTVCVLSRVTAHLLGSIPAPHF